MHSDNLEPATLGDLLRQRDGARCDHGLPLSGPCSLCADPLTVVPCDHRDLYGSLVVDGFCMECGTRTSPPEPEFDPRVRAGWLVPLAIACLVLGIVVGRSL